LLDAAKDQEIGKPYQKWHDAEKTDRAVLIEKIDDDMFWSIGGQISRTESSS